MFPKLAFQKEMMMEAVLVSLLALSAIFGPAKARLIEWGWDQPNNLSFRHHMDKLESAPFDGTILGVVGKDGEATFDMVWECWGKREFNREQFKEAIDDLNAPKRARFKHNFLRFNVSPGEVNWFDDTAWAVVLNNAKIAAWVAKAGELEGWMFDVEMYQHQVWRYLDQNEKKPASFEEYKKIVRQRGGEFMRAINSEYPDIVMLLTYAHALPLLQAEAMGHKDDYSKGPYALLPAFVDGMLEAADEKTMIVDSGEHAYGYKKRENFINLRKIIHEDAKALSAVPEIYAQRLKIGFGIWIDHDWRGRKGWFPHEPEKNHFKPEELQEAVKLALELTDGYVWIYSESLDWFSRRGLTEHYAKAVANAQTPPKKVPEFRPAGAANPKAKLIEWGGDSPSVQDFVKNLEQIEATPFDGTVISMTGMDGDRSVDMAWLAWSKQAYQREFFADAVKDLKAVKRTKFTDCFLRFNVTPGDVCFMDDEGWAAILQNAKVAAWAAKESNMKGWMFDVEQYEGQVFKYPEQNKMQAASFEKYQKAARKRGTEFIKAINSEFPDITILMTFGYSLAIGDHANLEPALYGLLPAFLDGMLEVAHPDTIMIDGLEFAYGFKTRFEFETLKALMRINGKALSAFPEIYEKRMKMGYGIWIDRDSGNRGWFPHEPDKNHFQPKELEESIRMGLELTETYVWLYSERLNWYTRNAVTEPYLLAVANAQTPPKKVPASKPVP